MEARRWSGLSRKQKIAYRSGEFFAYFMVIFIIVLFSLMVGNLVT